MIQGKIIKQFILSNRITSGSILGDNSSLTFAHHREISVRRSPIWLYPEYASIIAPYEPMVQEFHICRVDECSELMNVNLFACLPKNLTITTYFDLAACSNFPSRYSHTFPVIRHQFTMGLKQHKLWKVVGIALEIHLLDNTSPTLCCSSAPLDVPIELTGSWLASRDVKLERLFLDSNLEGFTNHHICVLSHPIHRSQFAPKHFARSESGIQ